MGGRKGGNTVEVTTNMAARSKKTAQSKKRVAAQKPAAKGKVAKAAPKRAPARKAAPSARKHAPALAKAVANKKNGKARQAPVRSAKPAVGATPNAAKPAHKAVPGPAALRPGAAPKPVAVVAAPARTRPKLKFRAGEFIVYPAHGVGRIVDIEEQEIAGLSLELYVIDFVKEKLRLKVPTAKAENVGMRKLSDKFTIEHALNVLNGRARIKRTMWSRRAQEYEAKINSGDLISVAEVVRDLFRSDRQPEQSYSERQLYEAALDRMSREIAAVKRIDDAGAVTEIEGVLDKNARRSEKIAAEKELAERAA